MTRPRRPISLVLGILFTGIGIAGIILPVLPSTVFFLIASALFIKSSPRLHRRLHASRIAGPYLRAYADGAGLSRRHKAFTIAFLWVSILASAWFVRSHLWVLIVLGVVAVGVTIHVATIRPRRRPRGGNGRTDRAGLAAARDQPLSSDDGPHPGS